MIITSSVDAVHGAFDIVQRKVFAPTPSAVTPEFRVVGVVIVVSILVVFAVGVVVLVVERHEISQRETVVRGDEIDARFGGFSAAFVQIRASAEPVREVAHVAVFTLPIPANRVPVATVPLRPEHRKVAHLITAITHVPRLRDELHLRQHRILMNDVEE